MKRESALVLHQEFSYQIRLVGRMVVCYHESRSGVLYLLEKVDEEVAHIFFARSLRHCIVELDITFNSSDSTQNSQIATPASLLGKNDC